MQSESFRNHLRAELVQRCKKNPRYSLRSFANFLQVDHSTLAKILSGKRPLGMKLAARFGERLGLAPNELARLFNGGAKNASAQTLAFEKVAEDTFQLIADWYHYAILELMRVEGFKCDVKWLAAALGITAVEAQNALERLERLGMISIASSGAWTLVKDRPATSVATGKTTPAHRLLQKQILEKALGALDEVPIELRNQSSVTMAISTDLLPEAIERITLFRRELAQLLSRTKPCDQVYELSISLFPVSKVPQPRNQKSKAKKNRKESK